MDSEQLPKAGDYGSKKTSLVLQAHSESAGLVVIPIDLLPEREYRVYERSDVAGRRMVQEEAKALTARQ